MDHVSSDTDVLSIFLNNTLSYWLKWPDDNFVGITNTVNKVFPLFLKQLSNKLVASSATNLKSYTFLLQ